MSDNRPEDLWNREIEEEQQIFRTPPSWLLRNGISLLFLMIVALVILSSIIRFSDKIQTRMVLTTENPPIRIMSNVDGQVSALFVQEKLSVSVGDVLAVMESSASYEDVLNLEKFALGFELKDSIHDFEGYSKLGALQNSYSDLITAYKDYFSFRRLNTYLDQVHYIDLQLIKLNELNEALSKKKQIVTDQSRIAERDYLRNKKLLEEKVISQVDFEKVEINYLNFSNQFETITTDFLSNQLKIYQMSNQKNELLKDYKEQERVKRLKLEELVKKIKSEIITWKKMYVLDAPIKGKVAFTGVKSTKQFVSANSEVFTIVPEGNSGSIIGRGFISSEGIGKVKNGMKAMIQLDGFPFNEYGSLIGQVKSIAQVPIKEGYLIEISLPQDLRTTYNKELPLTQEMQGNAFVIVANRSLLSKVFDHLISLFKNTP